MPTGLITNVLSVFAGSCLGCMISRHIPKRVQEILPILFGYCAMAIGINSIIKVSALTVPVIAVLVGYCVGGLLKVEDHFHRILQNVLPRVVRGSENMDMPVYITVVALFCFSGFGWYGVLSESIGGVSDILYSKSVLDFFAAVLFSALLGKSVCLIPIGQAIVFALLFLLGKMIAPLTDAVMFSHLTACGGILTLATGFRVAKIKTVPVIDMMPALILVLILSRVMG